MPAERGSNAETPDPDLGHGRGPEVATGPAGRDPLDPWAALPRFSANQLRVGRRIDRWARDRVLVPWLGWLEPRIGTAVEIGPPEVLARASGLRRPGMIAQVHFPALNTRLGIGLEVPLAHAIVDRLLGYDRPLSETRLQLTPVEWGIWTYLVVRLLDIHLPRNSATEIGAESPPWPLGVWDMTLDRVSPDPFDTSGLGAITTLRWPVRVGRAAGSVRAWLAEPLLDNVPEPRPDRLGSERAGRPSSSGGWSSFWHAEAATVTMPKGLGRLRAGGVLPLSGSQLAGTPQNPSGPIVLACELSSPGSRFLLPAEPMPESGGRLIRITGAMAREPRTPETLTVGIHRIMNANQSRPNEPDAADVSPPEVPVTLIVELGKVNLTLDRLADLKPGDVLELGRHSREPVELTSGGRLVARGELILIDTELGVRVNHVFL